MAERTAVAFLDFDGVISSFRAMAARGEWIDPIACEMIARLRAKHGFSIVISSSWRGSEHRCRKALTASGLVDFLHTDWRTNESPAGRRGEEIRDWLQRNGEPEFIIFDDETFDFDEQQASRLVKCDTMNGMLHEHYVAADELLARILIQQPDEQAA